MKGYLKKYHLISAILFVLILSSILVLFFSNNKSNGKKIDVKTFGAKGDGITDDTLSIQNAINSVGSNFTLEFPAGTYIIDTINIIGKNNFNIEMKGFAKPKGDISRVIFNIEGCSHFSITPMIEPPTVDWKGGKAIRLNNSSYGNISNGIVSFINSTITTSGDFIRIGSNVNHINITNNIFKGVWGVLSEDKIGVHDINVIGNTFYGCKPYVSGDLVEFNQPTNAAKHIVISKNTFRGTAISTTGSICIGVANCEYVTITKNTIFDSGCDGIHVEDRSNHVTISGNVISNCNGFGISVSLGVEYVVIENNILTQDVEGAGKVGIYCCGDVTRKNQNIKINNNTIDGVSPTYTKFSILMTYCTKVEVNNNLLKNAYYGAYCDSDDGYNSFIKNRIETNNIGLGIGGKLNPYVNIEYNEYKNNKVDFVDPSTVN